MSDDELRHLFQDAVADVAPQDRLGEIRRRTARASEGRPRRWAFVVLGAGTATAAVVGAGALVGQLGPDGGDPAGAPDGRRAAVAAYFIDDTPAGERLFREFQSVPASAAPPALALSALRLLEEDAGPQDPDYATVWPDGSFLQVTVDDSAIVVTLSAAAAAGPAISTANGLQQAVFTAQAAIGSTLPVTFASEGRTLRGNVVRDQTRIAPVNISDPAEGHTVDDLLTLRGTVRVTDDVAGGEPAAVAWSLHTADGAAEGEVARSGAAPVTAGTFEETADIADLAPGRYVLTVSAGADTADDDAVTDTRTITVR